MAERALRVCPSCNDEHPAGTTCAGGWSPYRPELIIRLTEAQMEQARTCAERVEDDSVGRQDRAGYRGDRAQSLDHRTSGTRAEIAVALFLGLDFECRTGRFGTPDVGEVHVRATPRRDGDLIIRPPHEQTGCYLLVIDEPPVETLVGWCMAEDSCHPEYLRKLDRNRPAAYAIPQANLRDPMELR